MTEAKEFAMVRSIARAFLYSVFLCLAIAECAPVALAEDGATIFRQNCISCHTIGGGRLVGPDLKGVTKRRDPAWIADFINNPRKYLDSNDPYILKLKEDARGAVMPQIPGMTVEKAQLLVALFEAESKLPVSQFVGLNIGDQPFSPADVRKGYEIFAGIVPLRNGGAACINCHSVNGLTGFGGGRLGPDLTKVFERMQGRKSLSSWLQAPATPTMQPMFANATLTNEEIVPLVAFLESEAQKGGQADTSGRLAFFFLGVGGAVFGFVGADLIWRRRFRGVRGPLVRGEQ